LSVLPTERPSTPRGKRRRSTPLAAAHAASSAAPRPSSFAAAGVPAQLVSALAAAGITTPFPIQAATLPDALAGRDILGRGQTGSGKTLAFCIPLAAGLADGYTSACRPRGLVLVPTRELASQVHAVLAPLAGSVGLSVATIYGGVPQRPQVAMLRDRADIVVACPGRLADLIEQGHCHLGDVEISVLDEADHMADLGFLPVVRRLLDMTAREGQRMLFSATLDSAVDILARRFMNNPARHDIDPVKAPAAMVHHLLTVAPGDRSGVVAALAGGSGRSLVFTRTKHAAHRLARQLAASGISAAELHGDLSQGVRERNLASFAAGAVRVIVATDVAARGIHVDGIDLVIHADSPVEHKVYLHRSGRTARAGATGTVITLQTPVQADAVRDLMRKAGVVPLTAAVHPGSALLHSIAGESAPLVELTADRAEVIAAAPASGRAAAALSAGFRGRRGR
jgi:superfamily II DNA/RNA helicase